MSASRPLSLLAIALLSVGCWGGGGWSRAGVDPLPRGALVDEDERVVVASRGERFDLSEHLEGDGLTVVEFAADW